jgi:hypothetical protein
MTGRIKSNAQKTGGKGNEAKKAEISLQACSEGITPEMDPRRVAIAARQVAKQQQATR